MIDLTTMSDTQITILRKQCLRSLYLFCRTVMGYDDLDPTLHGDYCFFLEGPDDRKDAELPRSYVKTWIGTIAYAIWIALPRTSPDEFPQGVSPMDKFYKLGPNIRVLVASYVISNAMKMVGLIRKTYERNQSMQILFPEVIPENFNKTKWSDSEATIQRSEDFTESTFEAGGIGGSTTSRHYDIIIEDDLIYANKDDLTGRELQPNQEDIDKAIGWHKLAMSLLVPGDHTKIHNIGTRWSKHDLKDYIRENEPSYATFIRYATKDGSFTPESEFNWPSCYPYAQLKKIRDAQGPYMFSTQYLGKPIAPEDMLFKAEWLQYYKVMEQKDIRIFTTTDLSLWGQTARKGINSRGVVLTCAWDSKNHCWILRYDVARFNPTEIMDLWYTHYNLFKPEVIGVEEVYYQKAISHFMRIRMEKDGWLPMRPLQTSTHIDKDVRIRALQPYAMNGAIHCRPDHFDFITEYKDYVPGSDLCRKDILDALAYQLQLARPGEATPAEKPKREEYKFSMTIDEVLESIRERHKLRTAFKDYALTPAESEINESVFDPFSIDDLELNFQ